MSGREHSSPGEWLESHDREKPPEWWLLGDDEWEEVFDKLNTTAPSRWCEVAGHVDLALAESNYVRIDDIRFPLRHTWLFFPIGLLIGALVGLLVKIP